ncbi:alpha/beta hydrolase [Herbiconiux sp. YIM B11900]|uniref:alpha/beta hydrolase n=1 Tax=Herbiconiux sp. YIM B11900 TaxID=3404131 RepID=UPI003F8363A1
MTTDVLSRRAREPDHVLRYGPGPSQVADLYLPPHGPVRGLVLALHGGFWRARYDRVHLRPLAEAIAAGDHAVALIEYRRIGEDGGGHPGTFDDVLLGIRTVPGLVGDLLERERRAGSGLDGAALGHPLRAADTTLIGHSAGGHLALWSQSVPEARVAHVIALAGVLDLGEAEHLRLSEDAVGELLHRDHPGFTDRLAAADPMRLAPPTAAGTATTLVHGTVDPDVPVSFSRTYAARDRRIAYHPLEGVDHFALIDPHSPAGALVLRLIASAPPPVPPLS